VVSGKPNAGSKLTCSRGSWAADLPGASLYRAPTTVTFDWRRGGVAIPGATGPSFTPRKTGKFSCLVVASNAAGSASRASKARRVFPETVITKSSVGSDGTATFSFKGIGGATGFKCSLEPKGSKPHFGKCTSPKAYTGI